MPWFESVLSVTVRFTSLCDLPQVSLLSVLEAVKVSPLIEKVSDHKDFKKLLRTRTNVLVIYTKTGMRRPTFYLNTSYMSCKYQIGRYRPIIGNNMHRFSLPDCRERHVVQYTYLDW